VDTKIKILYNDGATIDKETDNPTLYMFAKFIQKDDKKFIYKVQYDFLRACNETVVVLCTDKTDRQT